MRLAARLLFALCAFLTLGSIAYGQASAPTDYGLQGGFPTFGTNETFPLGTINLANGNVHVEIGLRDVPQRGKLSASQKLVYNSKAWSILGSINGPFHWQFANNWLLDDAYTSSVFENPGNINLSGPGGCSFGPILWRSSDGVPHVFPITSDCTNTASQWSKVSAYATDGSGYRMYIDCGTTPCTPMEGTSGFASVFKSDGTRIPLQTQNVNVEDSNGNLITITSDVSRPGIITDTLGNGYVNTNINHSNCGFVSGNGPYNYTLRYASSQTTTISQSSPSDHGITPTETVYCQLPINSNFGLSNVSEYAGTDFPRTSIYLLALGDGTSYQFKYDCNVGSGLPACNSPSGRSAYYGELTSITLPTGGTINFTYQNFRDANGQTNRWIASRTQGTSTWTYLPQLNCGPKCQTLTVTDPAGNQTVYTFSLNLGLGAWLTDVKYYQGAATGTASLALHTDYDSLPADPTLGSQAYVVPLTTTATVPGPAGNLTKKVVYSYDHSLAYSYNGVSYTGRRGQLQSVAEYAFNSSTPYRTTYFSYLNPDPPNTSPADWYNSRTDLLTERSLYDGANNLSADTTISNDDFAVAAVPSTVVQHDTTSANLNRGNPTTIRRMVSPGSYIAETLHYDNTGQVTQITDPNNNTYSISYSDNFVYDSSPAQNPPSPASLPLGPTNAYLTSVTLPFTGTLSYRYYAGTGKQASTTDQNAADSYAHYLDPLDRLTHSFGPMANGARPWELKTYSLSALQTDTYSTTNDPAPATNCASCKHTNQGLDPFGRPVTTTAVNDPDGAVTSATTYDSLGRVHTATNPYRSPSDSTYGVTTSNFDTLGRLTSVMEPDGSSIRLYYGADVSGVGLGGLSSQLCAPGTYGTGYPVLQIDEAGDKKQLWEDAFGRTIEVDEPNSAGTLSAATCYSFSVLDNLTKVEQKGGSTDPTQWRTRTFTYDSLSRLVTAVEPESGTTTYGYDANGNIRTRTALAPNQTGTATVTVTFQYDALNRLTQKSYSDGTATVTYAYDGIAPSGCTPPPLAITNGIGRRTGMCDAAGSEAWSYDALGQPLSDQRTNNGVSLTTVYAYNLDGSVATLTYPSGHTVTYAVDSIGRTISAKNLATATNFVSNAHYAPHGALASLSNGTSMFSTFAYNSRLQPCRIAVSNSSAVPNDCFAGFGNVLDLGYDFHAGNGDNGNVYSILKYGDHTRDQIFAYDALNRLAHAQTQTNGVTIPNANCWGLTFGYDSWGNLLTSSTTGPAGCSEPLPLNVSVNNLNQIVSNTVAGQTSNYCYDAAGNLIFTTSSGGSCPTVGPFQFTYDAENHLTSSSGVNYTYDGDGRRAWKSTLRSTCFCPPGTKGTFKCGSPCSLVSVQAIQKIYWYGMGSDPLDETDSTGSTSNTTFREYIFLDGSRAARVDSQATVNYYASDHLGTSRVVTDSVGTICYDADFYPFGGERFATDNCDSAFKFTGYERDPESGLDFALARHYSNGSGRFMSIDPLHGSITNPQSWNRYAYVNNNPLNAIDPSGMCSEEDGFSGCDWNSGWDDVWNFGAILTYDWLDTSAGTGFCCLINTATTPIGFFEPVFPPQITPMTFVGALEGLWNGLVNKFDFGGNQSLQSSLRFTPKSQTQQFGMQNSGIFLGLLVPPFGDVETGLEGIEAVDSISLVPFYPGNQGFLGTVTREFLYEGATIDRIGGSEFSRFFSPAGTPLGARSLPPGTAGQGLRTFRVMKPFEVESGTVAPAFGHLGFGVQYRTPVPLGTLLRRGILKEIK